MSTSERWKPHVTVAAVCEKNKRFLLVRENIEGRAVLNQPAGHLDPHETLVQAVVREMREETAYDFNPTALVGVYRFLVGTPERTYLRFAFRGDVGAQHDLPLDDGIIGTEWLTLDEIEQENRQGNLRTPMVMQCILDYLENRAYPLHLFSPDFA